MSTGKALLSVWVTAVVILSLPAGGQSRSTAPFHTQSVRPKVILPVSDPLNKGNWTVDASMSDEFNGTQLDSSRWRTSIVGWPGRPPALFVDHNVMVTSGALQITMQKEAVDEQYAKLGYHDYTTGAVQSTESVLYGYFEVRARAMKSAGSSGFWFSAKDQNNWNEIDVAEMGGRPPADPRRVFMSVHVFEQHGVKVTQNETRGVMVRSSVADGFHVYGLHWSPTSVDFYIDGRLHRHLKNTSWHTPATMILDAETQVDWWGMPLDSDLPSAFTIDYVRAWKQAAENTGPASASPRDIQADNQH
jgi:beta-glucanase (GH16 family)